MVTRSGTPTTPNGKRTRPMVTLTLSPDGTCPSGRHRGRARTDPERRRRGIGPQRARPSGGLTRMRSTTEDRLKYEYRTTFGDPYEASYFNRISQDTVSHTLPDDPVIPDGDGWEMCGSAASTNLLYWFWKRPLKKLARK